MRRVLISGRKKKKEEGEEEDGNTSIEGTAEAEGSD